MFDPTYIGAFLGGLLSFLSPCILPIVPFYLSYMAGIGINQISEDAVITRAVKTRAVLSAVFFSLGIITIFLGLGVTATVFGQLVREYFDILRWLAAAIIIVMGLHFLGIFRIGILYQQLRADADTISFRGYAGAYLIGLAFAFGWTPCVGPVLAALLFTAAGQDTWAQGASLLFVYGLGMTLPFILAALFIGPFMKLMKRFRRHLGTIEKLTGGLLVLFGVLIATNSVNYIANWLLENVPWFTMIG